LKRRDENLNTTAPFFMGCSSLGLWCSSWHSFPADGSRHPQRVGCFCLWVGVVLLFSFFFYCYWSVTSPSQETGGFFLCHNSRMRSNVLSFSLFCPLYARRIFLPSPLARVRLTRGGRGARRQSRAERQRQMPCPTRSARQRPTTPESASDRSGSSVHPPHLFGLNCVI
jgi:hypothetical protein